jgi:hypothetical protein
MQTTGLSAAFLQRTIMWSLALIGYYLSLRMGRAAPPAPAEEADLAVVPTAS